MGGGGTETTTQRSGSKQIDQAVDTIGSQLNANLQTGVKPYTGSLYSGLSGQTQAGVNSLMNAAGNSGGIGQAENWTRGLLGSWGFNEELAQARDAYRGQIGQQGYNSALRDAQSGIQGYLRESQGDAPGYAALRSNVANDTMANINAAFNSNGRFGGGSNVESASEGLGNALAGMDYQRYNDRLGAMLSGNQALAGIGQTAYGNMSGAAAGLAGVGQTAIGNAAGAAASLPGLYQAGLMPAQTQLQAGQIMDADAQSRLSDQAALFDRTQNAGWNTLQRAGTIINGTAGAAGQSTTSPTTPWWQTLAGGAIGLGSMFF